MGSQKGWGWQGPLQVLWSRSSDCPDSFGALRFWDWAGGGVCVLALLLIRAQRVNSAAELVEPHSEDMQSRTEASPPSPPRPSSTSRSPAPEPSRFFNQRDEPLLPAPAPPPALAREVEKAPSY